MKTVSTEKLSYDDFLVQYDGKHAEWVNGEVIMTPAASERHQSIAIFIVNLLNPYVELHKLGKVLIAPFQTKLGQDLPGREPDLLFVASGNLDRMKPTYLDGPADMAVEIISPESINRDRGEKFVEYESAGVSEYWLIDPIREQADFYRFGADDHYHPVLPDDNGIYHSEAVKGFWLRVSWLWEDPMPPILEVWKELNLL
ncbi:Uma2 family endonuclease [Candidatus Poribacteria bacterium]